MPLTLTLTLREAHSTQRRHPERIYTDGHQPLHPMHKRTEYMEAAKGVIGYTYYIIKS